MIANKVQLKFTLQATGCTSYPAVSVNSATITLNAIFHIVYAVEVLVSVSSIYFLFIFHMYYKRLETVDFHLVATYCPSGKDSNKPRI